ncbi:unnamed protein product [Paramecium primaurelia]|uniref:LITAF domain-containing protein n=1 Tax=Paramecium primaurelia TaxID=5886 RepID=A0A8S1N5C0_PARPR|nr:unnamed protein product [Paramecium primaurelia]
MNPNTNQENQQIEYQFDYQNKRDHILPYSQQQQPILITQMMQRNNANGCDFPADIICPYCTKMIQTHVQYKMGIHSWIVVLILLVVFFPLFFLPFCFLECQDKEHKCPHCNKKVGYKQYKIV